MIMRRRCRKNSIRTPHKPASISPRRSRFNGDAENRPGVVSPRGIPPGIVLLLPFPTSFSASTGRYCFARANDDNNYPRLMRARFDDNASTLANSRVTYRLIPRVNFFSGPMYLDLICLPIFQRVESDRVQLWDLSYENLTRLIEIKSIEDFDEKGNKCWVGFEKIESIYGDSSVWVAQGHRASRLHL